MSIHNIHTRALVFGTCIVALSAASIPAQEPFRYREFELGSSLASIAKLTGTAASTAKVIHVRPALIQELEWRPRLYSGNASTRTDPVDIMTFKFYDDQLFTVIADYDRQRTEGLAAADVIAAVTTVFGPVSGMPSRQIGGPSVPYAFSDTPLAIWGDADHSVTLLRVAYPESFRLVVASTRLDNLARRAGAAAVQLDADEAPQREIARQKREADVARAAQDKAKSENKATFKP
jgi:hypothetical protein